MVAAMILLRHGQSWFNHHFSQTREDPGIHDPALTPVGEQQAGAAAEALAGQGIQRILTSPYTRALQTAAPIARRLGVPVLVNPVVRERCAFACDVGTPCLELAAAWPGLDFAHLDDVWWPAARETRDQVIARAALFRAEMAALPGWESTLVVSHWGFILALTGLSLMNGQWVRYDPRAAPPPEIVWRP
jgi:glucosyl-3-phosphoglycerate phosphatase